MLCTPYCMVVRHPATGRQLLVLKPAMNWLLDRRRTTTLRTSGVISRQSLRSYARLEVVFMLQLGNQVAFSSRTMPSGPACLLFTFFFLLLSGLWAMVFIFLFFSLPCKKEFKIEVVSSSSRHNSSFTSCLYRSPTQFMELSDGSFSLFVILFVILFIIPVGNTVCNTICLDFIPHSWSLSTHSSAILSLQLSP